MVVTITFDEALERTEGTARSLLLGNGFSMAYPGGDFSYDNLFDCSDIGDDPDLSRLFDQLKTKDFEEIISALEKSASILTALNKEKLPDELKEMAARTRTSFINAVRTVHPDITFDVPEKRKKSCLSFLLNFNNIYTTNYDLLAYWVIQKKINGKRINDSFSTYDQNKTFLGYSGANPEPMIYFLHGALHIFADPQNGAKKVRNPKGSNGTPEGAILGLIDTEIREKENFPLFIANGDSRHKLAGIVKNKYLKSCYENLTKTSGNIFIFGNSARSEDKHIYDAIFNSDDPLNVYFCLYGSTDDHDQTAGKIANLIGHSKASQINYVDANEMNIWDEA